MPTANDETLVLQTNVTTRCNVTVTIFQKYILYPLIEVCMLNTNIFFTTLAVRDLDTSPKLLVLYDFSYFGNLASC